MKNFVLVRLEDACVESVSVFDSLDVAKAKMLMEYEAIRKEYGIAEVLHESEDCIIIEAENCTCTCSLYIKEAEEPKGEWSTYIEEEGLLISLHPFKEEVVYDFKCYDTYAIGTLSPDNDGEVYATAPKHIKMTYPSLAEIKADEKKADYVLTYRGLYDLKADDIHYGDICISMGEIVNFSN